jgi:lipopolysaccharide assembly protein B
MRVSWVEAALLASGAVLGWYATRRWRIGQQPGARPPSSDSLAGLNFLVNEQPDRAVEAFLRAVAADRDTVETQFALGALFRRRGEVDRAIRVHQDLIARDKLDAVHREQASYALAQDYLRAGLLDRAEKLLQQLSAAGAWRIAALRDLVRIYEVQRDWERAIAIHRELARVANPPQPAAIAHYYCELAVLARQQGDLEAARKHLRAASAEQRRFARAALLHADVATDEGETKLALKLLRRVLLQQPTLAGEVLPRLTRALDVAGRVPELDAWLLELAGTGREVAAALAHAAILAGELDTPALVALARSYVRAEPAVGELLEALLPDGAEPDEATLRRLCGALRRQALRAPRFRCSECGFSSSGFFWQCPGCKSWDTLQPLGPADLAGFAPAAEAARRLSGRSG